jgi:Bacterial membrane protein YfhO
MTPRRFALLLAVLAAAAWPDVLLGTGSFGLRDYSVFGYPLAHYHRECFWRGALPLWNPFNHCGLPFLAQWNTMVLYPGALLYLLPPLPWSLGLFMLVHLWLGGLGAYAVARRWTGHELAAAVAGVAYAFHGLVQQSLMWPNNLAAFALLPWVVLTAEGAMREGGRKLVIAAIVGAMQMLTGAPEVILSTWLLVGVLALIPGIADVQFSIGNLPLPLLRLLSVVLLVSLLSAAQLLPFLDLLAHSQRDAGYATGSWPLPATGPANLLVPLFNCHFMSTGLPAQPSQAWTATFYPGALVLVLAALAALRVRRVAVVALAMFSLLSLVLALGDNGPLYGVAKTLLPLGVMRYPVKFIIPLTFILPMLAAWAIASLATTGLNRRALVAGVGGALAITASLGVIGWNWPPPNNDPTDRARVLHSALASGAALAAGAFALVQVLRAPGNRFWPLALLAVLFFDLRTHCPGLTPRVNPGVFAPGVPPAEALVPRPQLAAGRAVLHPRALLDLDGRMLPELDRTLLLQRQALFMNANLLEGIPKADGFFSLEPRATHEATLALYAGTNGLRDRLADFVGITHANPPPNIFQWQRRPTALPPITAGQRPAIVNDTNTLAAIAAADWNPHEQVFVTPWDEPALTNLDSAQATVTNVIWTAHRIEFQIEAPEPTLAVIAQSYYEGWQATVNGQPAWIIRANHAFQAVPVPAGRSTVRLDYVDRGFQLGLALSALGLAVCSVLWWRSSPSAPLNTNH